MTALFHPNGQTLTSGNVARSPSPGPGPAGSDGAVPAGGTVPAAAGGAVPAVAGAAVLAADGAVRAADGAVLAADRAVAAMLEARSVALVGASPRPGSFGSRMLEEVAKSPAAPVIYPVNPRYSEIGGRRCYQSLADLPEAPALTLLAVPDAALEDQLTLAAGLGSRGAVIFGNAHEESGCRARDTAAARDEPEWREPERDGSEGDGAAPGLRGRLAAIARDADMALCGAGCMGFVNVAAGLRAIGYTEPDPVPAGPVALVTHSGSVFSALLRARRGFGFTLAVSSGQELVTTAADYAQYALGLAGTGVLGLVLEAIRDGAGLRRALAAAAARDIPVVLLTAGSSAGGRAMVAAHSGALAGSDGGWEALARAHGVHRVADLAEFCDTLELFAAGRRVARAAATGPGGRAGGRVGAGVAAVHDSGLERAHVVDVAESLGVPFAQLSSATTARLAGLLDPGLIPANPLDVWGTGADTRDLFGGCLLALAGDPAVDAVALAVDLVHELDGDQSYPQALLDTAARTAKPLVVLSNLSSAIDPELAGQLRGAGIPVLEGTRSGLAALRHLLDHGRTAGHAGSAGRVGSAGGDGGGARGRGDGAGGDGGGGGDGGARGCGDGGGGGVVDAARQARGAALLASGQAAGPPLFDLLADYGIDVARTLAAADLDGVLAAAAEIGYPVVLKTAQPGIAHKSDAGGVVLGVASPAELAAAYRDLAARLGALVLVGQTVPAGTELALGLVTDPELGPLVVVGAGGVLVEVLADRAVALPPLSAGQAADLVGGLRVAGLLAGVRGAAPADAAAISRAVAGLSQLAVELGDWLEALDINPLICGPGGAIAVDALAVPAAGRPADQRAHSD